MPRTIAIPRIILRYKSCRVEGAPPPEPEGLAALCADEEKKNADRVMVDEDYTFYSYGSSPYQKKKVRIWHGNGYTDYDEDYSDI